jgi:hypothetical protein
MDNLYFLFKIFRGKYVDRIYASPPKTNLQQYGGPMDASEFRGLIEKLEKDTIDHALAYD